MPSRPWYPWYPSDYRRDTRFLSPMADLLYRRMLDLYWEYGGPLPMNVSELSRNVCMDRRKVASILAAELSSYWYEKDGKLHNPRMDKELAKSAEIREKRAASGQKGGLAKAKANASSKRGSKQGSSHNHSSTLPKGNGAGAAPCDPKEMIWTAGVSLLTGTGMKEQAARSFLGKLAKQHGEAELSEKIAYLTTHPKIEPKAYLVGSLKAPFDGYEAAN